MRMVDGQWCEPSRTQGLLGSVLLIWVGEKQARTGEVPECDDYHYLPGRYASKNTHRLHRVCLAGMLDHPVTQAPVQAEPAHLRPWHQRGTNSAWAGSGRK